MAPLKENNSIPEGAPQRSGASISPTYLLIGSGKVARHFEFYFQSLGLRHRSWSRSESTSLLDAAIDQATHVLLLISDRAIEDFYKRHLEGRGKIVVHFSGALLVPGLMSAHPLMTFGEELYPAELYRALHFVINGASSLTEILPGLPNSFSVLEDSQKARYHAMCVYGGNFTTLLLQKMIADFQTLGIPASAARLYVEQSVANVFADPEHALTGPLARRDTQTVKKNLQALSGDPAQKIYEAFLDYNWPEFKRGNP